MILEPQLALPKLKKELTNNHLCLFAGSGISIDSGLKDWDGFVKEYIDLCSEFSDFLKKVAPELSFEELIADARNYVSSDQIGTVSALRDKIKEIRAQGYNTDTIDNKLLQNFQNKVPNEYHHLIVNTMYKQIITTNYDNLLEKAAEADNHPDLLMRSYTYTDTDNIASAIYQGYTSLIYAHGKMSDIKLDEIVLTHQDYTNIVNGHLAFKLLIESLFVHNSVLFVGYGGSDPHFEDVLTEVNSVMHWSLDDERLPTCYIMIKREKVTSIRETLNSSKRISLIPFDEYSDMKPFLKELQNVSPRPSL